MNCKICSNESTLVKKAVIRKKYEAEYYRCRTCDFMFIHNPTWLKEAYEKPINLTDTGYVMRNVYLSKKTLTLFTFIFGSNFTYLDYAGGYGMLTRLMRDYGLNFLNDDPYTENLFAQGFEYKGEEIKALTCFECFEHLDDPLVEIEKILNISKNVFLSTRLLPQELPNEDWEYYATEHGQHISFYSKKTFIFLAKKYNLHYYTNNNNLHFLTPKKLTPFIFNFVLGLTKFQIDILIRKLLKSKTTSDSHYLK